MQCLFLDSALPSVCVCFGILLFRFLAFALLSEIVNGTYTKLITCKSVLFFLMIMAPVYVRHGILFVCMYCSRSDMDKRSNKFKKVFVEASVNNFDEKAQTLVHICILKSCLYVMGICRK